MIEDQRCVATVYHSSGNAKSVKQGYNVRDLFGVSEEFYSQDNYAALTNANPNNQVYFEIWIRQVSGNANDCTILVEMDYIVEFFERSEVDPSLLKRAYEMVRDEENKLKTCAHTTTPSHTAVKTLPPAKPWQK